MQSAGGFWRHGVARWIVAAALISASGLAAYVLSDRSAARPQTSSGSVQVAGSESMRAVVTACAEDFMARNPKADIIVKGGGSGDGIGAVLHGIADIGMTSRDLSQRERDYAASKGIDLVETPLALDGVTVIVNRTSTIASLSLDQLHGIFSGTLRNWQELEGGDVEIAPFARAAGSGTAALFADRVMKQTPHSGAVTQLPTNEAIVNEIAARRGAIGYTALGALRGTEGRVRTVSLRNDAAAQPVGAKPDDVRSGRYPLARSLVFVTPRRTTDIAKAFVDFCLGASGQALVRRAGYISISQAAE